MKNYQDLDKKIAGLRQEYAYGKLEDGALAKDPFTQFADWFEWALRQRVPHLNAMTLATAAAHSRPGARIILLKSFDRRGFVFYSHYDSRKAREIKSNPRAEALFYWGPLERQVRIAGRLSKIPRAESEKYFASRPRESQLAAWTSHQSRPVKNRAALDEKYREMRKKFQGKKIPLPPFWGGYRLVPDSFEFWQGRENRLNDHFLYNRKRGRRWQIVRLQP